MIIEEWTKNVGKIWFCLLDTLKKNIRIRYKVSELWPAEVRPSARHDRGRGGHTTVLQYIDLGGYTYYAAISGKNGIDTFKAE
jgi:hypothetical protein